MRKLISFLAFLLVAILSNSTAWAQQTGEVLAINYPSGGTLTADQIDGLARDIRRLENQPLARDAQEARHVLYNYILNSPDIAVTTCEAVMAPLTETATPYQGKLLMQFMLSSAAFVIEHPDQANDPVAVNLDGLIGTLKAYEHLKDADGRKHPFMEKMEKLRRKDNGEKLKSYVEKEVKDC